MPLAAVRRSQIVLTRNRNQRSLRTRYLASGLRWHRLRHCEQPQRGSLRDPGRRWRRETVS
jgi:hypothetical protein